MARRANFGYFLAESGRSIISHRLMSFAAVCMIIACLVIMGSFSLLAVNVGEVLSQLEDENEFLAYIDETYTEEKISVLQEKIENIENVSSVTFISKSEAKAAYLQGHQSGLYESLPDEVFRDRFSIHVTDLEQFSETVEEVAALEGIVRYRAESAIADGFVMIRNVVSAIAVILVLILVILSLFIISNTVKLATYTRKDEIAIMKICGATNRFVRCPFVIEGMILGLIGAVLGFFLQWLVYVLIYQAVENSGALGLFAVVPFDTIKWYVFGIFAVIGVIIGACGSGFAIRKFLRV